MTAYGYDFHSPKTHFSGQRRAYVPQGGARLYDATQRICGKAYSAEQFSIPPRLSREHHLARRGNRVLVDSLSREKIGKEVGHKEYVLHAGCPCCRFAHTQKLVEGVDVKSLYACSGVVVDSQLLCHSFFHAARALVAIAHGQSDEFSVMSYESEVHAPGVDTQAANGTPVFLSRLMQPFLQITKKLPKIPA